MPLLKPKPKSAAKAEALSNDVPVVDISTKGNSGRVLKIELPPFKEYSPEDLENLAEENGGKEPVAICDLTGEVIFDKKNVNVIENKHPERKEYNGMVLCTKILRLIHEAVEKSKE